jgi:hypothetical protein
LEVETVSLHLIYQYYAHYERAVKYGKSFNEQSIRTPFFNLLNEYARKHNYEVIPEVKCMGTRGRYVVPDGVMKNMFSLEHYKEKKPKDPTIAEKFNTYKFTDHKTKVINLLKRVTSVSIETMKIIEEMKKRFDSEKTK